MLEYYIDNTEQRITLYLFYIWGTLNPRSTQISFEGIESMQRFTRSTQIRFEGIESMQRFTRSTQVRFEGTEGTWNQYHTSLGTSFRCRIHFIPSKRQDYYILQSENIVQALKTKLQVHVAY